MMFFRVISKVRIISKVRANGISDLQGAFGSQNAFDWRQSSRVASLHKQSGVALISVLLIFAIAAVLATRMMSQGSLQAEQASLYQQQKQLEAYGLGAESYAIALLKEDWRQDQSAGDQAYDHPSESWGQLDLFPLDADMGGGEQDQIRLRILPLDGFFNLNNLLKAESGQLDTVYISGLRRLLAAQQLPEGLADQTLDWIDSNTIPTGLTGSEDNDYLLKTPPYRSANQLLLDTDELALLNGASQEELYRFSEQVVALPGNTTLNINAANPEALAALLAISPEQAKQLLTGIEYTPVVSVSEFLSERALDPNLAALLTLRSRFFMVSTQIDWQDQRFGLTTWLERDLDTGMIHILQRRFQPVAQSRFQRGEIL